MRTDLAPHTVAGEGSSYLDQPQVVLMLLRGGKQTQ